MRTLRQIDDELLFDVCEKFLSSELGNPLQCLASSRRGRFTRK